MEHKFTDFDIILYYFPSEQKIEGVFITLKHFQQKFVISRSSTNPVFLWSWLIYIIHGKEIIIYRNNVAVCLTTPAVGHVKF